MTDDLDNALRRLNKALALLEQCPTRHHELAAGPGPDSALQQACAEITATIGVLVSMQRDEPQRQPFLGSINGAPAETFRTKLKVKDGGTLIAERIPTLQSPDAKDDLTRIRGIDVGLARRLVAIGVTRYAQIAAWRVEDVRGVASALSLGRSINQQNWIEQAHLLQGTSLTIANGVVPVIETVAETAAPLTTILPQVPALQKQFLSNIELDDILAVIRAGSVSRRTAECIATAQQRRQNQTANTTQPLAPTAPTLTAPPETPPESPPATIESPDASSMVPAKPTVMSPLVIGNPTTNLDIASPPAIPIHEQATQRLDVLEAEITTLGFVPQATRITEPIVTKRPLATLWHPQPIERRLPIPDPMPPVAGEADVEIVIRRAASATLSPRQTSIKALLSPGERAARIAVPLQPQSAEELSPAVAVEEASVVIVKRPTEKALSPGVAKSSTPPVAETTSSRRFVRNLGGER